MPMVSKTSSSQAQLTLSKAFSASTAKKARLSAFPPALSTSKAANNFLMFETADRPFMKPTCVAYCFVLILFFSIRQIQDLEACDEMYESLSRLNSNYYREKYPRLQNTSFTEITVDEYRMVLATDSLKQMDEMKKGMWKRLKDKFNVKSPQDDVKE
ncbi:ubiquinol-cytochrome-c reductase complex assembly factor 2 [Bufo bufo]|uniref:ubiquinol-cytochrome-c reductase complex assembly factor 2 n=1 Tax=Bufo bufo TaxID=8384 RepID=UPI001ABDA715|nr:ubiquinol-cytochrome-c reductase complex assembly factor 2 [Bufo bufo]